MKKFIAALLVLAAAGALADAGPFGIFRGRIFQGRDSGGCANGQCELPAAPAATVDKVAAIRKLPARDDLDPQSFAGALQKQLADGGTSKLLEKKLWNVVNGPDSLKRTRVLHHLEGHARIHSGMSATGKVDWSATAINWQQILQMLLTLLPKILALFGL